jgi:hypothetical protein
VIFSGHVCRLFERERVQADAEKIIQPEENSGK